MIVILQYYVDTIPISILSPLHCLIHTFHSNRKMNPKAYTLLKTSYTTNLKFSYLNSL